MLLKSDKHGVVAKPYYLMLKTVAFNRILERIGGRLQRALRLYFDIGAFLGVGFIAFILYAIARNAISLFQRSSQAGPTLVIVPLPGVTVSWEIFPYILLAIRSEEHTSELQSRQYLVCRLLLEKKKKNIIKRETRDQACEKPRTLHSESLNGTVMHGHFKDGGRQSCSIQSAVHRPVDDSLDPQP